MRYHLLQTPDHLIEELVHQLRFHHLRDINYDTFAFTSHPAGLGVGAAAAGEYKDTGVGPFQGLQIGRKLALGFRVVKTFGILLEGPVRSVFVDIGPAESISTVRWSAEVVDFVAGGAQALDDLGVLLISPAGGDVNLSHNVGCC